MPVLSFTLTHPHCRQLLLIKGYPASRPLLRNTAHLYASGWSIQPKISVYHYRVCTFKILLIIFKTFGTSKGKWNEANREFPVLYWCIPKSSVHHGQAGAKLLTPSWVLMQGLNPAQCQTDFYLKWQSSQAGTGFETETLPPGLTHSWGGPISTAHGISPMFPGECRRVSVLYLSDALWHSVVVCWQLNTSPSPRTD